MHWPPHKEGATYLDDNRSRPCQRFLQNRFVCLLLKHNPFKPRAQPRANQSLRAHSPEPTARKQKQKQNLAKPGKTPDPNPIQFLSPHKEGATYLDDDRSRPCRRFLQNRFVCLLLKHNPFKSRAQPRANQSPRAHSPEPTAQKTKAKAKPPKTRQNPPKPPKTPDPNPIQFLSPHKEGATYLDDNRSRPMPTRVSPKPLCVFVVEA